MEQIELLTEIAEAMFEFINEKPHDKSFSGNSVFIRFKNPNTKSGETILDKFLIETVAENILNIVFEFNLTTRVNKSLFTAYYGYNKVISRLYRETYFDGEDFVGKIRTLIDTTQIDIKTATKSVLEIYYAETLNKTIDFLRGIQAKVDAGETHINHP